MSKRHCYDYDSKISELCWDNEKVRKVDYGQVEYCKNEDSMNRKLNDLYIQKEKLLTQTSHIKNGTCSLKNQYFSS